MLGYGDGEGGDESMFYTYHQSSPYARSTTSSQQSAGSQQARLVGTGGIATARYPSIIDGVHFDLISADERKVAAQCKLCPGDKVIRGSGLTSSNFISHLRVKYYTLLDGLGQHFYYDLNFALTDLGLFIFF